MNMVVLYETNGKNRLLHKMLLDVGYQGEMITENRRCVLSDNCIYAENTDVGKVMRDIKNVVRNANYRQKCMKLKRCLVFKYK